MAYGNSRRDEQKSQLGSPEETNRVSVSNKAASFSPGTQMGEMTNNATMNALGAVSKFGTKLANAYIQKEKATAKFAGEAAFIAGEAFEDVQVSGDKFKINGYRALQAKTEAANMTQDALDFVLNKGYELDPEELNMHLAEKYKNTVDGLDPAVGGMVHDAYTKSLPSVIKNHTKLNTEYKLNETKIGLENHLLSSFGPNELEVEEIEAILDENEEFGSVFSKKDQQGIMASVINKSLMDNNVDLYRSILKSSRFKELPVQVRQNLNNNFRVQQNKAISNLDSKSNTELSAINAKRSSKSINSYPVDEYFADLSKFYRAREIIFEGALQGTAVENVVLRNTLDNKQLTAKMNTFIQGQNFKGQAAILAEDANILSPGKTTAETKVMLEDLLSGKGGLNIEVRPDRDNVTAAIIATLHGVEAANAWIAEGSNPQGEHYNEAVALYNKETGAQARTQQQSLDVVEKNISDADEAQEEKATANWEIDKATVKHDMKHKGLSESDAADILAKKANAYFLKNVPEKLQESIQLLLDDKNDKNLSRYRQLESKAQAEVQDLINKWKVEVQNATRDGELYDEATLIKMQNNLSNEAMSILSRAGVPTEFINLYQFDSQIASTRHTVQVGNDLKAFNIQQGIKQARKNGKILNPEFEADTKQAFSNLDAEGVNMNELIDTFGHVPSDYDNSEPLNNYLTNTDRRPNNDVLDSALQFIKADFDPNTTGSAGLLYKNENAKTTMHRLSYRLQQKYGENVTNIDKDIIAEELEAIKSSDNANPFMLSKATDFIEPKDIEFTASSTAALTMTDINNGMPYKEAGQTGLMSNIVRMLNNNGIADGLWNRDTYKDPKTGKTVNRIGWGMTTKKRNIIRKALKKEDSPLRTYIDGPLVAEVEKFYKDLDGKVSKDQLEDFSRRKIQDNTLIIGNQVLVNPNARGQSIRSQMHGDRNVTTKAAGNVYIHSYLASLAHAGPRVEVLDTQTGKPLIGEDGKAITKSNPFHALLDKKNITFTGAILNKFMKTYNDTSQSQVDMNFSQLGMREPILQSDFTGKGLRIYNVPVGIDYTGNPRQLELVGTISYKDIGDFGYENIEKKQAD